MHFYPNEKWISAVFYRCQVSHLESYNDVAPRVLAFNKVLDAWLQYIKDDELNCDTQVKWIHTWIIWYPTEFDETSHRLLCKTTFSNEKTHEKLAAKWCPGKLWGFIGLDRIGRYNVYDGFLVETRNVKP